MPPRDPDPPAGLTFSEVSGGATLALSDGTLFIVGCTRTSGEPTAKVLRVGVDGKFSAVSLATPRLGSAAAVVGDTLVVVGGNTTRAGVEVLRAGESAFGPLAFPPEASGSPEAGSSLVLAQAGNQTLVLGGNGTEGPLPVRTLDFSCTAAAARWFRSRCLPLPSPGPWRFPSRPGFRSWWASPPTARRTPSSSMVPRRRRPSPSALFGCGEGATGVTLPNGQVALVGGSGVETGAAASALEL